VFVELMPLLAGRTVLITVARVDDKTLRVNVIPAQAKADENAAGNESEEYTSTTRSPKAKYAVLDSYLRPCYSDLCSGMK
jgi:hypothetical protein